MSSGSLDKFCKVVRDIQTSSQRHAYGKDQYELVVESWIHFRRKRTRNHQYVQVGGKVRSSSIRPLSE